MIDYLMYLRLLWRRFVMPDFQALYYGLPWHCRGPLSPRASESPSCSRLPPGHKVAASVAGYLGLTFHDSSLLGLEPTVLRLRGCKAGATHTPLDLPDAHLCLLGDRGEGLASLGADLKTHGTLGKSNTRHRHRATLADEATGLARHS